MKKAKVRLQAKSKSKSIPQSSNTHSSNALSPVQQTSSLTESYAEIASHTPAPDAPVVHEHEHGHQSQSQDIEKGTSTSNPVSIGHGKKGGEGAIALLAKVYKEKGVAGWYKGLGAQIIKAVLCQGRSSNIYIFLLLVSSPPSSRVILVFRLI